jgi:ribosomal protein S18 acetylase RimI-like enzyme
VLRLEKVDPRDTAHFRRMDDSFLEELQPRSDAATDPELRESHFQQEFAWDGGSRHPYWAIVDNCRVEFISFAVSDDRKRAEIRQLYVVPAKRRQGHGAAMVRWLLSHLDELGIERIDLNVRRDNPRALAFWRTQGFGIAGYRLRQYRDPESGTAYVGALSSDF